jgi:hypothetical protein
MLLMALGIVYAVSQTVVLGNKKPAAPQGTYSTVTLDVLDVQRADTADSTSRGSISGYVSRGGSMSSSQYMTTHTETVIYWHFYTDQGIKVITDYAYSAWLSSGRPAHILFRVWQSLAAGAALNPQAALTAPPSPAVSAPYQPSAPLTPAAVVSGYSQPDAPAPPRPPGEQPGPTAKPEDTSGPAMDEAYAEHLASIEQAEAAGGAPPADGGEITCAYCGSTNPPGSQHCLGCLRALAATAA